MLRIALLTYYQVETNPGFKVIEMCNALAYCNVNVTLMTTSAHSRLKTKKYKFNNVTIIEFPDLLWGKFRQGIDFLYIFTLLAFI